MPLPYLRKTATYIVATPDGEQLFVDEFESEAHPGNGGRRTDPAATRLLLRNGEQVVMVDEGTFQRTKTGQHLIIMRKDQ